MNAVAVASEGLRPGLTELATVISKKLADVEESKLAVGSIEIKGIPLATSGPGIRLQLIDLLYSQHRVNHDADAAYLLEGTLETVRDKNGDLCLGARLAMTEKAGKKRRFPVERDLPLIKDETVVKTAGMTTDKDGVGTLGIVVGGTFDAPPNKDTEDRHQEVETHLKNPPKPHLDDSRVRVAAKRPVAVEILVGGKPLTPTLENGQAYVKLDKGTEYTVRLWNDSAQEMVATLHIDGLSTFAFSERGGGHYLVPAKGHADVGGWFITEKRVDAFEVTEYAKSAAAEKLKDRSKVGTITATFAAAWEKGQAVPEDEYAERLLTKRSDDKATGKGQPRAQNTKFVERQIGIVRTVISVRYKKP